MKKAYLYFLIPLVGLALFGVVYWQFSHNYERVQTERALKDRQRREAKVKEENDNRAKAMDEAIAAKKKRDTEREAKAARDAKDKDDRQLATQGRDKARADTDKLEAQTKRLSKEIEDFKKEIEKINDDKAHSLAEETFLKNYVKQVESNRASLLTVVEKIDAADKAAEAAAKQALLDANKKK